MRNIIIKEMKLSASVLSYLFIAFGLMFLLPGYPVLCGVFFVTLGIFQSFQNARETNDILFSALLPFAKRDVVKGKYIFVCFIELCSLVIMSIAVILRITVFAGAQVYITNKLMNANFFALGTAFFIFALFNSVFVGGFFKTAYKFGRPFVTYIIVSFLAVGIAEALHHVPGLEKLNAFGTEHLLLQISLLAAGMISYVLITLLSCKKACRNFETIDL
ncbi:MAG: ABC-2 transporter permease [Clostridia bacterium]|nr:ABC-2 transporter permease [Clostridia bacterium]